jgi:uncharacterized protein (DUF362 family)
MKQSTRREFLGAAGLTAGALLTPPALLRAAAAPASRVAIGLCQEYDSKVTDTLAKIFDQLGGLEKLVRNKTVAIKINLTGGPTQKLNGLPVEMTTWAHPTVIGATIALMGKAGAKRVRLLESHTAGTDSLESFMASANWNVQQLATAARVVEFENTNWLGGHKEYARFMVPGSPMMYAGYDVNPSYRDCDVMVSMAKLKNHRVAGITLSMKNMFGILPTTIYGQNAPVDEPSPTILPGNRAAMGHMGMRVPPKSAPPAIDVTSHEPGYRMPHVVPELVAARPIHIAIIDGIYSMEGGELPSGGQRPQQANAGAGAGAPRPGAGQPGGFTPSAQPVSKALHPGVLIAGFNPACTDAVATAVMGFDPMAERGQPPFETADNMLAYAEKIGIGTRDLNRIEVVGTPIAKARYPYHSPKQLTPA